LVADDARYGPGIQIDPLFPYYRDRSAESVAEEIELAGYRIVHYFVVNENIVDRRLIEAFRDRGIKVWAMVLGNGSFSTDGFPKEWPAWRMGLIRQPEDGFTRFSPFSEGYVRWKRSAMIRLATEYPFDGIEIAEPYFPEWNGLETGVYGDVGPLAEQAFRDRHGLPMPEFRDPDHPNYYKRNEELYRKWVDFRVDAVHSFIDAMINPPEGVRSARRDILAATWSLAVDAGPSSIERLREEQGLDAPAMIERVRPDVHFWQTHWPDWTRADLPGDHARKYRPFIDAVRRRFPRLPQGVQADIGSARHMIRSEAWLARFSRTAGELGLATWTAYEYHIGGGMYASKPTPLRAVRLDQDEALIAFSKRIKEPSDARPAMCLLHAGGRKIRLTRAALSVDGNRLRVRSAAFPAEPFELEFQDISDTPERWLYRDMPANSSPAGAKIRIPGWDPETVI